MPDLFVLHCLRALSLHDYSAVIGLWCTPCKLFCYIIKSIYRAASEIKQNTFDKFRQHRSYRKLYVPHLSEVVGTNGHVLRGKRKLYRKFAEFYDFADSRTRFNLRIQAVFIPHGWTVSGLPCFQEDPEDDRILPSIYITI